MPELQDLLAWKDLGVGIAAMVVFYKFASKVTDNTVIQLTNLQNQFLDVYNTIILLEEKYRRGT